MHFVRNTCSGGGCIPASANLVTNGSFEAQAINYELIDASGFSHSDPAQPAGSSMTGWTIDAGGIQLAAGNSADGTHLVSLDWATYDSRATIHQDITTVAGASYKVRFAWAPGSNSATTPMGSMSFSWNGNLVDTIEFTHNWSHADPWPWTWAEYTVQATSSLSTVTFKNPGIVWVNHLGETKYSNRGLMLDDVSVTAAVPEPGSMLALSVGIVGLLARRRH